MVGDPLENSVITVAGGQSTLTARTRNTGFNGFTNLAEAPFPLDEPPAFGSVFESDAELTVLGQVLFPISGTLDDFRGWNGNDDLAASLSEWGQFFQDFIFEIPRQQ